jgi:hypothetical protein
LRNAARTLRSYLSTTPIPSLWTEFADAIMHPYAAEGVSEAERTKLMSKIDHRFTDWGLTPAQRSAAAGRALQRGEGRDQDWLAVEELLLEQRSVLIAKVFNSAIPAFDSTPRWLRRLRGRHRLHSRNSHGTDGAATRLEK